jgi:hypothetical protein
MEEPYHTMLATNQLQHMETQGIIIAGFGLVLLALNNPWIGVPVLLIGLALYKAVNTEAFRIKIGGMKK